NSTAANARAGCAPGAASCTAPKAAAGRAPCPLRCARCNPGPCRATNEWRTSSSARTAGPAAAADRTGTRGAPTGTARECRTWTGSLRLNLPARPLQHHNLAMVRIPHDALHAVVVRAQPRVITAALGVFDVAPAILAAD